MLDDTYEDKVGPNQHSATMKCARKSAMAAWKEDAKHAGADDDMAGYLCDRDLLVFVGAVC